MICAFPIEQQNKSIIPAKSRFPIVFIRDFPFDLLFMVLVVFHDPHDGTDGQAFFSAKHHFSMSVPCSAPIFTSPSTLRTGSKDTSPSRAKLISFLSESMQQSVSIRG